MPQGIYNICCMYTRYNIYACTRYTNARYTNTRYTAKQDPQDIRYTYTKYTDTRYVHRYRIDKIVNTQDTAKQIQTTQIRDTQM